MKAKKKDILDRNTLVLYCNIHEHLKKKCDRCGNIDKKGIRYVCSVLHHLTKEETYNLIAELIELGYMEAYKERNKYFYKVIS